MALKYFFEYRDPLNNLFRAEIYNDDFTGTETEINGYCVHEYPQIEKFYQVIRGSGLSIKLEADQNLTLSDLYSDNEKSNKVILKRGTQVIFIGFIDPAGLFEDLVNDIWEITLDCADGLALLNDLSYVDENGFPFIGKEKDIIVINNCLKRTGITDFAGNPINVETSLATRYNGLSKLLDPLDNVYSNQERFYKDDGETIMSCKEVLESTLRKYGASICQVNGIWRIFSFYELLAVDRLFYVYNNGVLQSSSTTNYTTYAIASQISGAFPHWINANQRKEIVPGIGAVRINYEYGLVQSIISNSDLNNDGTTVPSWNILNSTPLTLGPTAYGVKILSNQSNSDVIETIPYSVAENDTLTFSFAYNVISGGAQPKILDFAFKVILTDGTNTYYLKDNNIWGTVSNVYKVRTSFNSTGTFTTDVTPESLPINGNIRVILSQSTIAETQSGLEVFLDVQITEVKVGSAESGAIKGETHTQQIESKNTRSDNVIPISVGDNVSDIYLGALYQSDQNTNTSLWETIYTPNDVVGNQSILEILSEYIALYSRDARLKITGDIYGYFEYLQIFTMDLVPNKNFMITSYSYNTKTGIVSCEWLELVQGNTFGVTYEFELDYGNVTKPTIKG